MIALDQELLGAGCSAKQAEQIATTIASVQCPGDAVAAWTHISKQLLRPTLPFAVHQLAYSATFQNWDHSNGPPPAWLPTPTDFATANVTQFAEQHGFRSYSELWRWSVSARAEFWHAVVKRLRIRFADNRTQFSPEQILQLRRGNEPARWYPDAVMNITSSCFQAAPKKTAIVFKREAEAVQHVSYQQLLDLTNQIANYIRQTGFGPGDPIAILMPMSPRAVAIYLGLIRAGCVVVAIPESSAAPEIEIRLQRANAKAAIVQDVIIRGGKRIPLAEKLNSYPDELTRIVVPATESADGVRWEDTLPASTEFHAHPSAANAATNVLFSSGTTGKPKVIPWSNLTPIKCAADAHFHHNVGPDDVLAWPTSLGWMMGPWLIYATMLNGATMAIYEGSPTSREFCQFISTAKVSMLGVVPSLVRAWRTNDTLRDIDWTTIRVFSSTGECSNPDDMLFLMSRAEYRPVIEYCGGTEIGGGYVTGTVVQPSSPATFTTPALGLNFMQFDEHGQESEKGEVFILPPSIGLSDRLINDDHHEKYYSGTPIDSAGHPLRRHGDELEKLPGGYYRVCGRTDDTMNLGGIKISAVEIETYLNTLPEIVETAAVAKACAEGGPAELCVYAVLNEPQECSPESLRDTMQSVIKQQLNPLIRISHAIVVDSLPRTPSNKIKRRELRDKSPAT